MKKAITLLLAALLAVSVLSGCTQREAPSDADGRLSVVTTIFAPYDFAREITGDSANIKMLLPPASESHSYEPTPQDVITIQGCDVFIYVGGDSDAWVTDVLSSMDTSAMRIVTLMDCVETVTEEIVEGMEHDHDHEEEHEHDHEDEHDHDDDHDHEEEHGEELEYDEHVWTSPANAKLIVQKISDTICEADAANANAYRNNTSSFLTKLDELDAAFRDVVDNAKRKTIIVGDRFPFRYLADAYGLDYFAAFPGCSTESEAGAATVKFLIDKVKDENIPVIFHIELSNQNMANTISEGTGAKVMLLHACHNISRDDFLNGASYLDLMNQNVEALKEALQ